MRGRSGPPCRAWDPPTRTRHVAAGSASRTWSIYWADSRYSGPLEPPVVGAFSDGVGIFENDDAFNGKPIRVRYMWSRVTTDTPRWEQAFSSDGGVSWETNWINDFTRTADPS